MTSSPGPETEPRGVVRRHPVLTAIMIASTLLGALAGLLWLDFEWSVTRRLLAGAIAGAGSALIVLATRMLGAFTD